MCVNISPGHFYAPPQSMIMRITVSSLFLVLWTASAFQAPLPYTQSSSLTRILMSEADEEPAVVETPAQDDTFDKVEMLGKGAAKVR